MQVCGQAFTVPVYIYVVRLQSNYIDGADTSHYLGTIYLGSNSGLLTIFQGSKFCCTVLY